MERRLAAILSTDVVGYSRLMAADEEGTLAQLKAHRKELIKPKTAEHQGRVVKLMGDGTLMEFASVVDALHFAIAVQRAMVERNAAVPDDHRVIYRIGINIGDIIVDGDDIYGDGVNVAARLQEIADPGGICVSRTVFNHVRGKVDLEFEDLGDQEVKNIPEPVGVFRVQVRRAGADTAVTGAKDPSPASWKRPALVAATAALVVAAGIALWMRPWEPAVETASVERMAFPLPDKPSIAVLPFTNMSGDPEQESFTDGMTDDLITDLSKVSGLFVIARNSTFVYKNQPVEVRKVAEALGVRYVLEGSVRRAGDTVRVNAQLIDATTGGHVWADRYDGSVVDIFSVQDDFIRQIVGALALQLTAGEQSEIAAGQTDQIDAREAFQKGWERYLHFSREENAKAVPHFKKAIALDPAYGRAYAALALVYLRGCNWRWLAELDLSSTACRPTAVHYLGMTEEFPTFLGHIAKALNFLSVGEDRHEEAFREADRALKADPNDPEGYLAMGWAMVLTGRPLDGLGFIEKAMRLNPNYPAHYALALGMAHFTMDDPGKAAEVMEEGLERNPGAIELAPPLAAMYGRLGLRQKARATLLLWKPTADERTISNAPINYNLPYRWSSSFQSPLWQLKDGLHVAALPMEVTIPGLIESLKSDDFFERRKAVKTLGHFRVLAEAAVPALVEMLADEEETLRSEAVLTLAKIGPGARTAIPTVKALLDQNRISGHAKEVAVDFIGE